MATTPRQLVIFDVCDTLYDANTTIGFLRHYASATQNRRIARRLDRWLSRKSPFFYLGAAAHRLVGHDLARNRMIAALAGEPRQRLVSVARDYVRHSLPDRANAALHDRLAAHHAAADRVVLVSSSLDLVVDSIADLLGTEYRASTLEFAGDICTGRLLDDLTGNKSTVVQELLAHERARIKVYTDNRSDRALVAMADEATIVIPRGADDKQWAGAQCEYLKL